jgi:hypothetical protein
MVKVLPPANETTEPPHADAGLLRAYCACVALKDHLEAVTGDPESAPWKAGYAALTALESELANTEARTLCGLAAKVIVAADGVEPASLSATNVLRNAARALQQAGWPIFRGIGTE